MSKKEKWKEELQNYIGNLAESGDEIKVVIELLHIIEMILDI